MPVTAFPTRPEVRTLEILEPARLALERLRLAILLIGVLLFELDDLRFFVDDLRFTKALRAVLRTIPFVVPLRLRLFNATSFLVAAFCAAVLRLAIS